MKFAINPGHPQPAEYSDYFYQYIKFAIDEGDIAMALENQIAEVRELVRKTESGQLTTVHEPYRWSITQALGHLVDQERIFGCRAARYASNDDVPLPGYDQEVITNNAGYERCDASDIVDEFEYLRRSNMLLFARLNDEQWQLQGQADNRPISVRAIAYLLVGHQRHHMQVFAKRLGHGQQSV